jgi:hypothetical protein
MSETDLREQPREMQEDDYMPPPPRTEPLPTRLIVLCSILVILVVAGVLAPVLLVRLALYTLEPGALILLGITIACISTAVKRQRNGARVTAGILWVVGLGLLALYATYLASKILRFS